MSSRSRSLTISRLVVLLFVGGWLLSGPRPESSDPREGAPERVVRDDGVRPAETASGTDVVGPAPAARPSRTEDPGGTQLGDRDAASDAASESRDVPSAALSGRALLADGTPIADVWVTARIPRTLEVRGSTNTGDDGTFDFAVDGDDEATIAVDELGRIRVHPIGGEQRVTAPAEAIELRYDALLVEAELPEASLADMSRVSVLAIEAYGVPDPPFRMRTTGGSPFEGDGRVVRVLLPTGPGYAFQLSLLDGSSRVALVPPGTPSGRVSVRFEADHPDLGTVRVVHGAGGLERPDRMSIRLEPVGPDDGPKRWGDTVTVQEPTNEGVSCGLLPGRYEVTATLFDLPPLLHGDVRVDVSEIEIIAGVEVQLDASVVLGGRIGPVVGAVGGAPENAPLYLERAVEGDAWERVGLAYTRDDGFIFTNAVPLGQETWTQEVLPVGPVRLRLVGDGWETVEQTFEILAGVQIPWEIEVDRAR